MTMVVWLLVEPAGAAGAAPLSACATVAPGAAGRDASWALRVRLESAKALAVNNVVERGRGRCMRWEQSVGRGINQAGLAKK